MVANAISNGFHFHSEQKRPCMYVHSPHGHGIEGAI